MDNQLAIFEQKPIRKVEYNGEMYFSIIDIIEILTENDNPSRYWQDLKRKSAKTEGQLYDFIVKLKLKGTDGKNYPSDCANTEGVLRVIMSVPSPKAEPLKLWLAQVGTQSLIETENPEIGIERFAELYKAKGYSDEWIQNRLKSIETRKLLTDEWKNRGVTEGQEYSILTATIAKQTFGLTPSEHKDLKGLQKENLRDHMTPLELIFTMLGEEVTRSLAVSEDAQGFNDNHDIAQQGGKLAGDARQRVEQDRRVKVVSSDNYLKQIEEAKGNNELLASNSEEKEPEKKNPREGWDADFKEMRENGDDILDD
jgi:DNA-damage-inducible protein D